MLTCATGIVISSRSTPRENKRETEIRYKKEWRWERPRIAREWTGGYLLFLSMGREGYFLSPYSLPNASSPLLFLCSSFVLVFSLSPLFENS